ncbi:ATP-binding protein [Paenibacillus sp. KQZ6P-2]|uniref:ATP-binding protein n=1 Tax=Paenibacillus mangrovi TaxID=2931978 RepID=A0A9X1WSB7_9BACL|nr:ATP-binding protein [Paenibacillus mangrovi]MCJ8012590.1 ATP-binding protein [Paenibacillus mangrovi]
MECVIFIGIQASGKSTFYQERFFKTHMRINLDMLKTRNREDIFIEASLRAKQPFVIDNTNSTMFDRQKYIEIAKQHKFKIIGYYFEPDYESSLERNDKRQGKERIAEVGIKSTMKKLQAPLHSEGFDELYQVRSLHEKFEVEALKHQKR